MEGKVIRGGLVGSGKIAAISHMPVWRAMKDVEIVSTCDTNESSAAAMARRFNIPRSYQDLSHMLGKENLDFIDICTPPSTHALLSVQAMEAGWNVLVEKPMAVSLSEANDMLAASKRHGVKLCVIHNLLFIPAVQAAKSAVAGGDIGDLLAVDIRALDRRDGALSEPEHWCHSLTGGIFGEYAPHPVYLLRAFLGKIHLIKVVSRKSSEFPWVAADELKVLVEAEKGIGSFTISCNSQNKSFEIDIFGTRGRLHVDNFTSSMTRRRFRGNRTDELVLDQLYQGGQQLTGAVSSFLMAALGRRWYKVGHQGLMQGFVRSIIDDTDPPVLGEDGRETIRLLEEIWKQMS
jgi:predicted dehydrogenase